MIYFINIDQNIIKVNNDKNVQLLGQSFIDTDLKAS